MARLAPGVGRPRAQAAAASTFQQVLQSRYGAILSKAPESERAGLIPELRRLFVERLRFELEPAARGFPQIRKQAFQPLLVLMGLVALVLLIACANVANLLLARAGTRRREIAVRLALGAGRFRLMRQLISESLLLAGFGGLVGLLLSRWATGVLISLLPSSQFVVSIDLRPDARILAFTAAVSFLTGLLFGTAPAWGAASLDVNQVIKGAASGMIRSRFAWSRMLVVSESALCVVLLLGAGLFIRSLINLKTFDAGISRHSVVLMRINAEKTGYKGTQLDDAYRHMLERLGAIPGVRSASLSWSSFADAWMTVCCFEVPGRGKREAHKNAVTPRYFETMGTPLLLGRDFTSRDTAKAPKVVIVNEAMSRHYFGNNSPVGQRFSDGAEIVGLVKDAKYMDLREQTPPLVYYPLQQAADMRASSVQIRLADGVPADRIIPLARKEVESVHRDLVANVTTLSQAVDETIEEDRLMAKLSGFFGGLAVLLCSLGIYGVTSYAVARRTSEIGIRMALGARRSDVLLMVLKDSAALAAAGILIGLPAALAAGRVISSMLFGLTPHDLVTVAGAALAVLAIGLAAAYVPARRAATVEPMQALRYE
jgi:predicted permease